jgi:hypothetical protein
MRQFGISRINFREMAVKGPHPRHHESQLVPFVAKEEKRYVIRPIADYLTRIRNAVMANHRVVEIPSSRIKRRLPRSSMTRAFISYYSLMKRSFAYDQDRIEVHPVTNIRRSAS